MLFQIVLKGTRNDLQKLVEKHHDQLVVLHGGSPSAEPLQFRPELLNLKKCVNIRKIQIYLKKVDDNGKCDNKDESTFDVDDSNFYNLNDPMDTKTYLLSKTTAMRMT